MANGFANGHGGPALDGSAGVAGEALNAALTDALSHHLREVFSGFYGGEERGDYQAAEVSRYLPAPRGVDPLGSGADYHYAREADYFRVVERARKWDRDNMVVGQGVNRLVGNVVQDGFNLDVQTGDDALNAELAARWHEWASTPSACDFAGELTFAESEALVFRHTIVDGDHIVLPTSDGSLQFIENHRLRNPSRDLPNCIHGVEKDVRGRRAGYWLTPEDLPMGRPVRRGAPFTRYAAWDGDGIRQVLHIFFPRRMSQTRGVTPMAPSVIPIQYHDDLQFATMLKAKVASFIAIFRQYDATIEPGTRSNRRGGARTEESQSDGSTRAFEEGMPAAIIKGDAGEKLMGFSPQIPSAEFFPHASLILTFVSINLDLPLAVLLLDPSKTNFSGWRGAIDQARQRFRQLQRWLVGRYHVPVYMWKVRQWAAADPAIARAGRRSGVKLFGHEWNPPSWAYIEPNKDATADKLRLDNNLTSPRRRAAERGLDWDDLTTETVEDRAQLIEKAIDRARRTKEKYPEAEVTWRDYAFGQPAAPPQPKPIPAKGKPSNARKAA